MTQLIIATANHKKLKELKKLLEGVPLKIVDLEIFHGKAPKVIEDKKTFVGNARKKALAISRLAKDSLVIADDSGLVVKALKGAPGVNSARYAGKAQDDEKNIVKLLKNLQAKRNKDAYFICTAVVAKGSKVIGVAEGRIYGTIINEKIGENGFGYDPIFVPKGYKNTFACMKSSFKNRISHRAKALQKARLIIKTYLKKDSPNP